MVSSTYDEFHQRKGVCFVRGDLVIFTGYLYTPDYVYIDQYEPARNMGIVIGPSSDYYDGALYRVYWFRTKRITETTAGHMRLAYIQK
jgi:hypothetical protein